MIDDDGFIVAESGAALLYVVEKAGKLIPVDFAGRMQVVKCCFAAFATFARPLVEMTMIDIGVRGEGSREGRATLVEEARRWFDELERRLDGREWIACDDFTVADILLAIVLRQVRNTDLIEKYPRLKTYYEVALARPAWQCTLQLCAERQGVTEADLR